MPRVFLNKMKHTMKLSITEIIVRQINDIFFFLAWQTVAKFCVKYNYA